MSRKLTEEEINDILSFINLKNIFRKNQQYL